MGFISAAAIVVCSTVHKIKGYSPDQLVFDQEMILPIKHIANWILICKCKQKHIKYDNVREIQVK